jgi:hypothetical protein
VVVVSERARQGLALAPFPLALTGLSPDEVEAIGTGSYLVNAVAACGRCHDGQGSAGETLSLSGGRSFTPMDGVVVHARNLTPHPTAGLQLTREQFVEALQTGKDLRQGGTLLVMPWPTYRWMTVADLEAIYAYLRQAPAVDAVAPADTRPLVAPGPAPTSYDEGDVPRLLTDDAAPDLLGERRGRVIQPLADPTNFDLLPVSEQRSFARGSYLANAVADCNACHTNPARTPTATSPWHITTEAYLAGGAFFALPGAETKSSGTARVESTDLRGAQSGYAAPFFTFARALTEGVGASGDPLSSAMPWTSYRSLVPDDQAALYGYIRGIPRLTGQADRPTQPPSRACAAAADCTRPGETCDPDLGLCVGAGCEDTAGCGACLSCLDKICRPSDPACFLLDR